MLIFHKWENKNTRVDTEWTGTNSRRRIQTTVAYKHLSLRQRRTYLSPLLEIPSPLITNHFFQSMLFNLAVPDTAHPFLWRRRPLRGQANNAQQPSGLTGVICQKALLCLRWSHGWIYPGVNGDSPRRPWTRHSDYTGSLQVALIDVACVYLFAMPQKLWI